MIEFRVSGTKGMYTSLNWVEGDFASAALKAQQMESEGYHVTVTSVTTTQLDPGGWRKFRLNSSENA